MAFVEPLSPDASPGLAETFNHFREILGFVPNSLLTMQRRPAIVKAFGELTAAVMDPEGSVPNGVDEEIMRELKKHWSEEQIVEMLGAVCLYGFLNRWNDSMATDLEDSPRELGERLLARGGWTGERHKGGE